MYSYANFEISLTASDSDKAKIAQFLAAKLENQADVFDVAEWPATSFHVEELAIALAQFAIHASFNMDGCIVNDYASSDFSIAYANGTLTVDSNEDAEYDAIMIQFDYPDYEMFCNRFWDDDNDCPLYTEEEYEEFCSWMPAFIVGDRILENEPCMNATRKYRITPDAVIPESSDDDEDDED